MLLKVVIITVVILALLGLVLLLRRAPEHSPEIGFRDAVMDPERFSLGMEARNRERLAIAHKDAFR